MVPQEHVFVSNFFLEQSSPAAICLSIVLVTTVDYYSTVVTTVFIVTVLTNL